MGLNQNALNSVGRVTQREGIFTIVTAFFNKMTTQKLLTSESLKESYTIEVNNVTGLSVGNYCILFNTDTGRFFLGTILDITDLVITFDSPLDSDFPIGSKLDAGSNSLKINGSTPQIFTLRSGYSGDQTQLPIAFDVTRIMIVITCTNTPDFSKFGDIAGGLTKGVVMRKNDGVINNYFNLKTNGDISNLAYDVTISDSSNPALGANGVSCRFTFTKLGSPVRIGPGEDLEVIIQDDLSSLLSFKIMAQGHIADYRI